MFRLSFTRGLPVFLLVTLLLAACGAGTPVIEDTPRPTSRFPTSAAVGRPTLPPTWTPTPTPTITLTPTITSTPSPTPTRTLDEVCDGVQVFLGISETRAYQRSDRVDFFAGTDDAEVNIVLMFYDEADNEVENFNFPGGQEYFGRVPLAFDPGSYRWALTAETRGEAGLCEIGGTFTIEPEPVQETSLRELLILLLERLVDPPPESTPEATP